MESQYNIFVRPEKCKAVDVLGEIVKLTAEEFQIEEAAFDG